MRQQTTAELRPDHGEAAVCGPCGRATGRFGRERRRSRSNFLETRFAETKNRAHQHENPGNVGSYDKLPLGRRPARRSAGGVAGTGRRCRRKPNANMAGKSGCPRRHFDNHPITRALPSTEDWSGWGFFDTSSCTRMWRRIIARLPNSPRFPNSMPHIRYASSPTCRA